MKKITLSLVCLFAAAPLFAQVTVYTDAAAFDAAFDGTLAMEDFSGADPDEPNICGTVISSEGNTCFPAGVLESGFEVSTIDGGDVVYLPAGFLPSDNTTGRVGANDGVDGTVITFTGTDAVYAAGHSIHVDNSGDYNYKVYNADDELIYEEDREYSAFVGIISTEPIKRIEFAALMDNGDLIGDLQFGTQDTAGTIDNHAVTLSCYPNPAGNTLNIVSGSTIAEVTVINLLGQTVLAQSANDSNAALDMASVPSGNYFVRVTSSSGTVNTLKVIKE